MTRRGTVVGPKQKAAGLKNLAKANSSRVGLRGQRYRRRVK